MIAEVRWFETTVATWTSGSDPTCQPNAMVRCFAVMLGITGTSRKEFFCGLEKPQLTLWCCDGVHLSVTLEPIRRIIRVQDGTKKSGEIGFLPDFWGRVVPLNLLTSNHTCLGLNIPFTTKIDDVGVNPSGDLDIYTHIHTRKGVETARRNGIHGCESAGLKNPYQ